VLLDGAAGAIGVAAGEGAAGALAAGVGAAAGGSGVGATAGVGMDDCSTGMAAPLTTVPQPQELTTGVPQ